MRKIGLLGLLSILMAAGVALAQDPVKLHPDIYKVEFENSQVRVMRATLAPHQKTDLIEMRDTVVVPLTDYESVIKDPAGKTTEVKRIAGKPAWLAQGSREIEARDKTVEAILIELKSPAKLASPQK
ncbi:MAG: hypothetical protein WA740_03685 [Candidatus Binataceae bacterium]